MNEKSLVEIVPILADRMVDARPEVRADATTPLLRCC